MSENFVPWDSARFIKNEEEARAYLDACMEEDPGDGALIRHALGVIARVRGMSGLADATGLSREGLYKAPAPARPQKRLGLLEGKLYVPDDFDAPLPPEILAAFEGGGK